MKSRDRTAPALTRLIVVLAIILGISTNFVGAQAPVQVREIAPDDPADKPFGIRMPLRFFAKDNDGKPVEIVGEDRDVFMNIGETTLDKETMLRENKQIYYVDLFPILLENIKPIPGLPSSVWKVTPDNVLTNPTAPVIVVTFKVELCSPELIDTCKAWLRDRHLKAFFDSFADNPMKTPKIDVQRRPVRNLWIGVGWQSDTFRLLGSSDMDIRSNGDRISFQVTFTPESFKKYRELSSKGEVVYQYLAMPNGMMIDRGFKEVESSVTVESIINEVLSSTDKSNNGETVLRNGQKYLTQFGRQEILHNLAATVKSRVYVEGDAAGKFLLEDPVPPATLDGWLDLTVVKGQELVSLMRSPENLAFAQRLAPTMQQSLEQQANEMSQTDANHIEKGKASNWSLSLMGAVVVPPVAFGANFGLSGEDRERRLNSNITQSGVKWGTGGMKDEFVPVELAIYKLGHGSGKAKVSMTSSIAIGVRQSNKYISYPALSPEVTPEILKANLKTLRDECQGFKPEDRLDLVNQMKFQLGEIEKLKKVDLEIFDKLKAINGDGGELFKIKGRLASLEGRYKVEVACIPMGEFKTGNDRGEWDYSFGAETLGVVGWVQETDGANTPGIGGNRVTTECVMQKEGPAGTREVKVQFITHTPVARLGFMSIVVKKP